MPRNFSGLKSVGNNSYAVPPTLKKWGDPSPPPRPPPIDARAQPTQNRSSHRKNNTHTYNIPYCRTQHRQMSFFPRTIPEWNSLPQEIVAAKSLDHGSVRNRWKYYHLADDLVTQSMYTSFPFPLGGDKHFDRNWQRRWQYGRQRWGCRFVAA